MKKSMAITMILSLILGTFAISYADEKPVDKFTDVGATHWAMHDINELVARGIINGYPDFTFRPEGTITAAEFIKIVASLDGKTIEKTGEHWASGYIDYAIKEGYVKEGMFSPDEYDKPINRQKMAVVMATVAEKKDDASENAKVTTEKINKLKLVVKDYDSICGYCKEYIAKAMLKGIITGYPDKTFKPANTATRAEAVTMIRRVIDKSVRKNIELQEKKEEVKTGIVEKGEFNDVAAKMDNSAINMLLMIDNEHMKERGKPNSYVEREINSYNYTMFKDPSVFKMKYLGRKTYTDEDGVDEWHEVEMKCNAIEIILLDKDFHYVGKSDRYSHYNDSKVMKRYFHLNQGKNNQGIDISGDPTDPKVKYLVWVEKTSYMKEKGKIYIVENNIDYKTK